MFTKLIHFVKMSWMLTWRMLVIGTILFAGRHNDILPWVAIGASAISVFVFNKTLRTWPIFRLFGGRKVVIPADSWGDDNATSTRPQRSTPNRTRGPRPSRPTPNNGVIVNVGQLEHVQGATNPGRMTGFEPKNLETQPVPHYPLMQGRPGAGLHGATGMSKTNIKLGVKGEENFARALASVNQLARFSTIWSVPVPDQDRFVPGPYGTDIDCILSTGSAIFLVDLKNYKSGDVRYHSTANKLLCDDGATGKQVGEVKTMSRNMEMATNAVRRHFPDANIVPVVVFMPTDKGEGVLDNVVWPGGIPAMNLTEFISVLQNQQDFNWSAPHGGAVARLGNLLPAGAYKV